MSRTVKVRATERRQVEVELSAQQVCAEAAKILRDKHNIIPDSYIEDGKVTTYYGRNNLTEYHGEATPEQLEVYTAIKLLEQAAQ